jgi:aminopeptidase C
MSKKKNTPKAPPREYPFAIVPRGEKFQEGDGITPSNWFFKFTNKPAADSAKAQMNWYSGRGYVEVVEV